MAEQPGATDPAKRNNRTAPVIKEPDFTEIEKQYLEGKISAKQFQKYLQDHKVTPAKAPVATSPDNTTRPVERMRQETAKSKAAEPVAVAKTNTIAPPAAVQKTAAKESSPPAPAASATRAAATPKGDTTGSPAGKSALSEVEAKMEELLQLKAAREKAALTNAMAATNGAAKPTAQTKRQRLDEVLKLYVDTGPGGPKSSLKPSSSNSSQVKRGHRRRGRIKKAAVATSTSRSSWMACSVRVRPTFRRFHLVGGRQAATD